MKKIFFYTLLMTFIGLFSSCGSTSSGLKITNSKKIEEWGETPGKLGFKAESPLYKADANFRKWVFGKLNMPNNDILQLDAIVYIDINSVYERTIRLTQDLKTDKYLDGKNFPMAKAIISDVKLLEGNRYQAKVSLDLKGVTKELSTTFVLTEKNNVKHVKGEINVLRKDFNVGNDKMKSIKNEVLIYFDTALK